MRETPQTLQGSPPGLRGQHLLHRPRLIGLPDGKERCDTAIPSDGRYGVYDRRLVGSGGNAGAMACV